MSDKKRVVMKSADDMDDETFTKHLNARHMPMAGLTEIAYNSTASPSILRAWRALHRRQHEQHEAKHDHHPAKLAESEVEASVRGSDTELSNDWSVYRSLQDGTISITHSDRWFTSAAAAEFAEAILSVVSAK